MHRRMLALLSILAVLSLCTLGATSGSRSVKHVAPQPLAAGHISKPLRSSTAPPTTADCQAQFGINCYSPNQFQQAYNLHPLYSKGITGAGRTIVIVDAFGSPTIKQDLHTFDQGFGLVDPPSLKIIQPAGPVPPFDPNDPTMAGWAFETSLDVEYAHAIAPGANILLVETPVAETEGVTGFPEIVKAENYVIDHNMGDVISQSFGATEQTFPNPASLLALRGAFVNASQHNVTVLAGTGDAGATNYELDGTTLYPYPVVSWPASDPLVTALGGTQLSLDANGNRLSPDVVWNDGYGATGGGLSTVFPRPTFQNSVKNVVGYYRGVPDISMSAAVNGGALVYGSFSPQLFGVGYFIVGGTSEATPEFAGIVALAAQAAGHPLGNINHRLYNLMGSKQGIVDVTSGNNSFAGVTGYTAGPGYDLASGLGTINGAKFVPALAGGR